MLRKLSAWLVFLGALPLVGCNNGGSTSTSKAAEPTYSQWTLGPESATGTADPVTFTVSGTIRYEDRLYGRVQDPQNPTGFGFYSTAFKPVRAAKIDVLDSAGNRLATTASNSEGGYALTVNGAGQLQLRILAQTDPSAGPGVTVQTVDGHLIAVTKSFNAQAGGVTVNADIPYSLDGADFVGGAFNILDIFTAGGQFVKAQTGRFPQNLNVFWQPWQPGTPSLFTGFCSPATDSCPDGEGIYVLGGNVVNDHDEYDDDVLWHEYGHFLEYELKNLDSLGGPHDLGDSSLDLRLAWSEGWSDYLEGAIKNWLRDQGSDVPSSNLGDAWYVDTQNNIGVINVDFGSGTIFGQPQLHATNESAVAKVLWNLLRSNGLDTVWSTFWSQLPNRTRPASLETYWNAWLRATGLKPIAQFRDRAIDYAPDAYEQADNFPDTPTPLALTTTNSQLHNLYQQNGNDVDFYAFNPGQTGITYRVETYYLTDGVDTRLKVTAPSGGVWANDNFNNMDYLVPSTRQTMNIHGYCGTDADNQRVWIRSRLASTVEFPVDESGPYLIEVSHPAQVPLAAGYYGGYRIRAMKATTPPTYPCP